MNNRWWVNTGGMKRSTTVYFD